MIGSLRGVLLDRFATGEALVEVGGVGYRVTMVPSALAGLGDPGDPVFLHIHTHVREDALVLYAFPSRDERTCFEALITAHGVGPALGLAILSAHSPASLARALATDDVDALTMIPGVGKKTAARLLVELKAKLDIDLGADLVPVNGNGLAPQATPVAEVRAALAGLGYGLDEVRLATQGLPDDGAVEDLLKSALRQLAVAR
ncbi:MAG: holliday junction helicase RuvA [Acidimicrobiaceae bacterium]|jgi:Holliday junction DNA helicase RuvA|nr:holliday junction helicase RuvA [Acidimicrobiaceae bacterium]MDQ1444760.1 holliday junction helicase RuvA [Acidimicrobiaceae bacterium]